MESSDTKLWNQQDLSWSIV